MRLSIRAKLLVGFAIVVGLSYFVQILRFQASDKVIRVQIGNIQLEKAQNAANEIKNFISKIELEHLGIATAYKENTNLDQSHVPVIIKYTLKQNDFFQKISILTTLGRELIKVDRYGQTPEEELGFEIPTTSFGLAVTGQTGISKVYFSEKTSIPQINIFSPVFSDTGEVIAVIKGQLSLDRLWDLIAQVKLEKSGFAYVVDEEGRLIAHTNLDLVLQGPNLKTRKIIFSLLTNSEEQLSPSDYSYINEKNIPVISNGIKIPNLGWAVIVEQPASEAFAKVNSLQALFNTTLVGSLVLLFIISLFLSESFSQPIRKLKSATELLKLGNLDTQVNIKSGDEIEDLANSFNLMAKKQKNTFAELKENIKQLEEQKTRLDKSAQLLLRRDLDVREINDELEKEKNNILAERNKLEIIISGITDAVIAVDLKRNIIIFNKAAEELTGFKIGDVLGKPVDQIIKLIDNKKELELDTYCPISLGQFEGILYQKKGLKLVNLRKQKLYVDLISGQIREGVSINLGCILTLHDVTKATELEEMKIDFVSMAAHELRTPLTVIRGYTSLLLKNVDKKLSAESKENLHQLSSSAKQLGSLIDNLLSVSRIERGVFEVNAEPLDLVELCEKTVESYQERSKIKKHTFLFIKPKEELALVNADQFRIQQVLFNLLTNAETYTKPGGKITLSLTKKGKYLIVSINDTGIGIPSEALPKLFTKFFRVSGQLEEGSKGTGLGLYISKEIINMHQGKIWVESKLDAGSTFYFSLPIASDSDITKYVKKKKLQEGEQPKAKQPGSVFFNRERMKYLANLQKNNN